MKNDDFGATIILKNDDFGATTILKNDDFGATRWLSWSEQAELNEMHVFGSDLQKTAEFCINIE